MPKNNKRNKKVAKATVDWIPSARPVTSFQLAVSGEIATGSTSASITFAPPQNTPFRVRSIVLDVMGSGRARLVLYAGGSTADSSVISSRVFILSQDIRTIGLRTDKGAEYSNEITESPIVATVSVLGTMDTCTFSGMITGSLLSQA